MRKYQKVEKADVLGPKESGVIKTALTKLGRKSMADLPEEERKTVSKALKEE